ncbi:hypothetical protein [Williamsia soli]|uniref:hypothetical protein n=1 Tax=Williamsia soli TaxID=364929 RepID=UPI001F1B9F46|nr:hypothetical protein [Williamsia soli]
MFAEGVSFLRSYQQANKGAVQRRVGLLSPVFRTSDPTFRAVFAEDAAALIGLAVAFVGNTRENDLATTLRHLESEIETDPRVTEAVLTLATPEEASLSAD